MSTLELYWPLASNRSNERLKASNDLISLLENFQQNFKSSNEESDEEDEDMNEVLEDNQSKIKHIEAFIEKHHASDVSYAIKRLIRGLASPRESSRLGFAVTLTQLISQLPLLTIDHLLPLIKHYTEPIGNIKGSEERDLIFGRLFGIQSLVESGLLSRSSTKLNNFLELIQILSDLGNNKVWLKEATGWTLLNAFKEISKSNLEWLHEGIEKSLSIIFSNDEKNVWGPEKIGILLWSQSNHHNVDYSKFISNVFKNSNPLASQNLTVLARILREASIDDDKFNPGSGVWKPQLHWVWPQILDIYFNNDSKIFENRASFQDFYRHCIDESLFLNNASPQRKYWGFSVFSLALPNVDVKELGSLFTPNFMRCWINNLRGEDRMLHKAAMKIAQDIQPLITSNPQLGLPLILQLLGKHGSANFDKITGTKTIANILSSMTIDGVKEYVKYLINQLESDVEEGSKPQRKWALDQLLSLIRNNSIPKSDEILWLILQSFTVHGYFISKKPSSKSKFKALSNPPKPALVDSDRSTSRSHLLSSLGDLSKVANDQKLIGRSNDGELWVKKVNNLIKEVENDKNVNTAIIYDENLIQSRKQAEESLKIVNKSDNKNNNSRKHSFELLLLSVILQSYDNMEGVNEVLDELTEASKLLFNNKSSPKKSKKKTEEEEEEPSPMAVLVDILVSLLEKPSSFLRTMAINSFTAFSSEVDEEALEMIFNQLTADVNDNDNEGEDKEDEVEEMNDVNGNQEEDLVDDASDISDDDKYEDANEEVDPEFVKKIAKALGQPVSDDEDEGNENENEESNEIEVNGDLNEMNDDQMMMLDEQLAEIFRSKNSDKKSKQGAQREAQHAKNRLIDLLDVYTKKQSSSKLILKLILPLLEIIINAGPSEQELSSKSTSILRNRIAKSKETPTGLNKKEDLNELIEINEQVHNVSRKSKTTELLQTCSLITLYLIRVAISNYSSDSSIESKFRGYYEQSWKDYSERKHTKLQPSFFIDYIRRYPVQGYSLIESLMTTVTKGGSNIYRQIQALNLIQVVFSQHKQLIDAGKSQEMINVIPSIRQGIYSLIVSACEDKESTNANRLKEALRCAMAIVRVHKRIVDDNKSIEDSWDLQSLQSIITSLSSIDKYKGVHALSQQLNQLILPSASNSNNKKRKSSVSQSQNEKTSKKNKQKQNGNEEN